MNYSEESTKLHERLKGKLSIVPKLNLDTQDDLSLAYTPGVAGPCELINKDFNAVYTHTIKQNTVAVVTDGTSVLGLGDIGPHAALPVMEGKAILFKQFANIDAWPICLNTTDTKEIINTVRNISPGFGGINLEDISAPRCFEIEDTLQDIGIPVFHDDQHGTAIVVLAGLINACKVLNKDIRTLNVVVNGAGSAGIAITKLLLQGKYIRDSKLFVNDVILCDSKGAIYKDRTDLNPMKIDLLKIINKNSKTGSIQEVMKNKDVFVGVSRSNLIDSTNIQTMNPSSIVFAMANPVPEIMPDEAKKGGAKIVGTGRSDFDNQLNNVLAFPGIFRGALDSHAPRITNGMKLAAALALANSIHDVDYNRIVPSPLDKRVSAIVAEAVKRNALKTDFSKV